MLAGQDNDFETPITPTLVPVIIPAGGSATVLTVPTRQSDNITSFRSTNTNFVWTYGAYGPYSASNDLAALSISNTTTITGTAEITPTLIFSQTVNPGESRRGLSPSVTLGDNLLAYTTNRELHVRTYQGTLDLTLENGVAALYDCQPHRILWRLAEMSFYDPDEPISIVEDLDPEPPSKPGSSQRIELLVGVIFLSCVLAFVALQWWHQQAQISDYASGQAAMASNDWDSALTSLHSGRRLPRRRSASTTCA